MGHWRRHLQLSSTGRCWAPPRGKTVSEHRAPFHRRNSGGHGWWLYVPSTKGAANCASRVSCRASCRPVTCTTLSRAAFRSHLTSAGQPSNPISDHRNEPARRNATGSIAIQFSGGLSPRAGCLGTPAAGSALVPWLRGLVVPWSGLSACSSGPLREAWKTRSSAVQRRCSSVPVYPSLNRRAGAESSDLNCKVARSSVKRTGESAQQPADYWTAALDSLFDRV